MVWDNVTSYCTANPFCWLLGDYARVPKGFQRRRNVPEPYFLLLLLLFFLLKCGGGKHAFKDTGIVYASVKRRLPMCKNMLCNRERWMMYVGRREKREMMRCGSVNSNFLWYDSVIDYHSGEHDDKLPGIKERLISVVVSVCVRAKSPPIGGSKALHWRWRSFTGNLIVPFLPGFASHYVSIFWLSTQTGSHHIR